MNPWLVVPTLGNRDDSLAPLLRDAGMPHVTLVTDSLGSILGPDINIHRWWNHGIKLAVEEGADVVVICNDDVAAEPGALLELAAAIEPDDWASPMLVWPTDRQHSEVRITAITGYCFALDPKRIRPDESFKWWYGDHDLHLRACAMNPWGGAQAIRNPGIKHLRVGWEYDRPVQHLIDADRALFNQRYPALLGGWK